MMWSLSLAVTGCLCVLVLAGPCCCDPLMTYDIITKPLRPSAKFSSPQSLRMYLDQLGEFYSYQGRPRFGKRTVAVKPVSKQLPASAELNPEQPSPPELPDILEILQQYYQPQEQD